MTVLMVTKPSTPVFVLTVPEPQAAQKCKVCDHPRNNHSTQGCLYNGQCPQGCMVKYMDRDMFE